MPKRLREGTNRQKLLLAGLVGLWALGVAISCVEKLSSLGGPDLGWYLQWNQISPTREDTSRAGLRGGGRALAINGIELAGRSVRREVAPSFRREIGALNELVIKRPGRREPQHLQLEVRERRLQDLAYAEGNALALGLLFFVVGMTTFILRPWETSSWALLALCTVVGGALWNLFPDATGPGLGEGYFRMVLGLAFGAVIHASLAFPVVHPLLLRGRGPLIAIYATAIATGVAQLHAWQSDWQGIWRYLGAFDAALLLVAILYFIGRCAALTMHSESAVAQRSRILLAGAVFGGALPVAVRFVQLGFGKINVDPRYAYWSLAILLWALARSTLRSELLHARVAVRRAAIYAATVIALTATAMWLTALSPYLVAMLLLPLLYLWPRFEAKLNQRFYPKRARLPELVREVTEELAQTSSVSEALEVLSRAMTGLFDARAAVAFLFPGTAGPVTQIGSAGAIDVSNEPPLEREALLQLMVTTQREVKREHIAVEPQYARIRDDCYACLDRLGAELVLPLRIEAEVVGGLALGERTTGDPYDGFDVEVLTVLSQGAMQDVRRIEASRQLRQRELEFSELKRFFPPQIIEQVMARGGAAEMRSQRRRVTVFFADLRGFTAFSERSEPEDVMATLEEFHAAMGRRITDFRGTLERFVGDGFMVFFNDPVPQPDHVRRAAAMALAMLEDVDELRQTWAKRGWPIDVGMGISTGYATVGFVGYEGRRDYAVIGNVTNLASRLSDEAEPGQILITASVRAELSDGFKTEPAGAFELAGFSRPQPAYRLLAG